MPDRPSVPEPSLPDLLDPGPPDPAQLDGAGPDAGPTDERPNRAARRRKRVGVPAASTQRGVAPHARGAQGRRVNPIRRTG